MAQISVTIPDAQLPRVIAAICDKFNFTDNKLANETQGQFSKRMMAQSIKQWVKDSELGALALTVEQARVDKQKDIDDNVTVS